jgi:hypothetical protein
VGCVTQYGLVLANVQPWHTRAFIIGGAVVLVYFVGTSLPAYLLSCHDFQHCVAFAAQKPTNWSKSPHIYVGQEIDAAMRNIALWMITVIALTGSAATVCTTGSANAEPPGPGGQGGFAITKWCDGQPYPDASYWHQLVRTKPLVVQLSL